MQKGEPRTFRATIEAWLGQLLLPLCFFVLLTITAINAAGLNPAAGFVGLSVLFLIVTFDYLLPMIRNWLSIDARSIEGSMNGRSFQVYLTEVKAAWMYERWRRRFLCIGTREGTLVIPMRFLDVDAVWDRVRSAVPPAALEQDAKKNLPDYRDWESARTTFMEDPTPRQVADHWLLQIIGWTGVSFFGYGVIQAIQQSDLLIALVQLAPLGVCLSFLVGWGITEVGPEQVCRYTMSGRWAIAWEDVRWIEMDLLDAVIVLCGDDRRLVIPGPLVWNYFGKKEAMALLLAQAEHRCIPLRRSVLALFKLSRNTRRRKKSEDEG